MVEFAEVMEYLRIMRTIVTTKLKPNAGENPHDLPPQVNRNSYLLPKMSFFLRKIEDGHFFLETFKVAATGIKEGEKAVTFKMLCGPEVATWLQNQNENQWEELEKNFRSAWYKILQPKQAIIKVRKLKQEERENICIYIIKFEEFRKFIRKVWKIKLP